MKKFFKFILLAQMASDSGKGYKSSKANSASKALSQGYGLKDAYIKQAIHEAKRYPHNIAIATDIDPSWGMNVILFDIKGFGQISFHSFVSFGRMVPIPQKNVEWNGIRGGSLLVCVKIAKRYNLPFYTHS